MNQPDDLEARLQRTLSTVAGATRATNRWNEVAATIENPGSGADLDYVRVTAAPGRRVPPMAAIVAFVAVLAGVFGVASLSGGGGSDSPQEAVEHLFDAMANEDAIGVLQTVAPSERRLLVPVLQRLERELDRLEVTSDRFALDKVEGVDIAFADLQTSATPLSDDYAVVNVASVRLTGGVRVSDLPFAAGLRDVVLPGVAEPDPGSTLVHDLELVTVKEDGGWHLSLQATLANFSEAQTGIGPDFVGGIPERGAESPEAAGRAFYEASFAHDYERMIELTPIDEAAPLHIWGRSLVAAARDTQTDGWKPFEVRSLEVGVEDGIDGSRIVRPTRYELHNEQNGRSFDASFDGRCIRQQYDGSELSPARTLCEPHGGDPLSAVVSTFYSVAGAGPPTSLAVVEHDGRWFVSPIRSFAASIFDELAAMDPEDAARQVRASYFGAWWAATPDEYWDACDVDRPAFDASEAEGEAAFRRCNDALPEGYRGPVTNSRSFFFEGLVLLGESESDGGGTTIVIGGAETTVPASVPTSGTTFPAPPPSSVPAGPTTTTGP